MSNWLIPILFLQGIGFILIAANLNVMRSDLARMRNMFDMWCDYQIKKDNR